MTAEQLAETYRKIYGTTLALKLLDEIAAKTTAEVSELIDKARTHHNAANILRLKRSE